MDTDRHPAQRLPSDENFVQKQWKVDEHHSLRDQRTMSESHQPDANGNTTALDAEDNTTLKTSHGLQDTRAWLGLQPAAPVDEEHDEATMSDWWWPKLRIALREPFAEFFGTFILVMFGDGSVAQVLMSAGETSAPGGSGFGDYQSISWGWGIGIMLGIYVAGDSGAYLKYVP